MKKLLSFALSLSILMVLVCSLPVSASAATSTVWSLDFEDMTVGDHLTYVEKMPELGNAPTYPENYKWGIVSNNGYVTYTDVNNPKSKVANTYAETLYTVDGTAVTQTPHQGRTVSSWTQENNLTVVDTMAHTGTKSFEIKSADMAYVTGIYIEKAGEYTLSYYVSDFEAIKNPTNSAYNFGSGVFSAINIGQPRTTAQGSTYYTDTTLTSSVKAQMPNQLNQGGQPGFTPYTFDIFRSKAALANATVADGETWYKVTHTFTTLENHKKIYFGISNYTGTTVYIDDITLTTEVADPEPTPEPAPSIEGLTTAYNNAAALKTADNTSVGQNGMRLYNEITKAAVETNDIVEFGAIVTVESYVVNELTFDTEKYAYGAAWNKDTGLAKIWEETEDAYVFTAYLYNIPAARYTDNYVIRAYAKDSEGNYYYGDTATLCVFDIAYAIDCGDNLSGDEQTAADIAAFEAFANYDGNYAAYDAWLVAENKEAGSLRSAAN